MSEAVTPGVVLRTRPLREADLVVVALTPDRGKLDCIARGARRSRKRFPGGLPVGARGELSLGRSSGSLTVLSGFSPSRDHGALGRDLEVFAYVAYLCELTDQLVSGSLADPGTFARLCAALEVTIEAAHSPEPASPAWLRRYELGLLDGLGLLPAFERCGVCGSPAHEDRAGRAFSTTRGGALCLTHARGARRVTPGLTALALVLVEEQAQARAQAYLAASRETRRELRDLCRELIQPHLRGPLRSLAFFAQINAPVPRPTRPAGEQEEP